MSDFPTEVVPRPAPVTPPPFVAPPPPPPAPPVVVDATHPAPPPSGVHSPEWETGWDAGWKSGWDAALAPPPAPVAPTIESHMIALFENVLAALEATTIPRIWITHVGDRLARAKADFLPPVIDATHMPPPPADWSPDRIAGTQAGWTAAWSRALASVPHPAPALTPAQGERRAALLAMPVRTPAEDAELAALNQPR